MAKLVGRSANVRLEELQKVFGKDTLVVDIGVGTNWVDTKAH